MVGNRAGSESLLEPSSVDQFASVKGLIPFVEVSNGRVNPAIAQDGTGQALIGPFEMVAFGGITESAVRDNCQTLFVSDGVNHSKRLKNVLAQEVRTTSARTHFDNEREQSVSRVAVLVFRAWRKNGFVLLEEQPQDIAIQDRNGGAPRDEVLIIQEA